jgi:hypothetical protein
MHLWSIHEVCCGWREEISPERLWTEIVRICPSISISIRHMSEEAIISRLDMIPPIRITSTISFECAFCLKNTIDRSPSSRKEVFDGEMRPGHFSI